MNVLVGVPLLVVAGALEGWLAQVLAPLTNMRPEFLVLIAVSAGLIGGYRSGLAWGAAAGLAFDVISAAPLGAGLLPMALVGFGSAIGQAGAARFNRLLPLQAALLGSVVFNLLHMLLLQLSGWGFSLLVAFYEVALPSALLSLLLMPAVYGFVYFLWQRSHSGREIGW